MTNIATSQPESFSAVPPGPSSSRSPGRDLQRLYVPQETLSPVTQYGSFEFDRIIKEGEVFKRTRKTKSWKSIYIILRPNVISFYRNERESTLRHKINLPEVTAVARQKDPRGKDKYIFGVYTPSRNYHLAAHSDKEAQGWVETIRREARIDEEEEEMILASPGGANTSSYRGFERSIDAHINQSADDPPMGYVSSSDPEILAEVLRSSKTMSMTRDGASASHDTSYPTYVEYSGAERNSFSDFSESAGPARMSALSLSQSHTDTRPSTSSQQPSQINTIYGHTPTRPSLSIRNPSQMSGLGLTAEETQRARDAQNEERVVYHSWFYLLKSKSGVRQWKKIWLVVRAKALALYKNEDEYRALLILPLSNIIDTVEIDAISKSKKFCMQIITEERNYRFCAFDDDNLLKCIGTIKSLLAKQKARRKEKEIAHVPPVVVTS